MKTDPKAGDVFDYVEPREPKTKGVVYEFVEGMSSEARAWFGSIAALCFLGALITIAVTTLCIVEAIQAPAASLEKKGTGE